MDIEQRQQFEAVLHELRMITAELRLLRSDLHGHVISPGAREAESMNVMEKVTPADSIENEEEAALAVYDWLTAKGITVKGYREQSEADKVFDRLALFLGERFANLVRVHDFIRRSLSTGNSFTLNLSTRSQDEITDSTQFCTMLSSYAFLSSYRYNKYTKTIYATPQRVGKVINFFTGGWFERFAYLKIEAILSQRNLTFTCLPNPQITFQNGDDFELDLLFLVDNQPLWMECKTGEYAAYIAKYANARKILSVPKERAFLVILDIADELTENLSHLYDITVANERNFVEKIGAIIHLPEVMPHKTAVLNGNPQNGAPSKQPIITPHISNGSVCNLRPLLNKYGLRPVVEHRKWIIEKLIANVAQLDEPIALAEIKTKLATQRDISKSKMQDALNAVVRGECLLDCDDQIVRSFTAPFMRLVANNPAVIEEKCIESYARVVLMTRPDYFDSLSNVAEFERVVAGKAPDMATIERLKEKLRTLWPDSI